MVQCYNKYKSFRAFGEQLTSVGSFKNTHRFTGKEYENSGVYYFGARYYDPWLGRFLTPDPLGKFSKRNPITVNPYVYCLDNPLKFVDPDGEQAIDIANFVQDAIIAWQLTKYSCQQRVNHGFSNAMNSGRSIPIPSDFLYSDEKAFIKATTAQAHRYVKAIGESKEVYFGARFGLLSKIGPFGLPIKCNISIETNNLGNNPIDLVTRKSTIGLDFGVGNVSGKASITFDPLNGISGEVTGNVSAGPVQVSSDGGISVEGELPAVPGVSVYVGSSVDLTPDTEDNE